MQKAKEKSKSQIDLNKNDFLSTEVEHPSGTRNKNKVCTVGIEGDSVLRKSTTKVMCDPMDVRDSPSFPQGSNDVLEVLCSGETSAGKLLMHFLFFYGRHFDSQSTCIDVRERCPDSSDR